MNKLVTRPFCLVKSRLQDATVNGGVVSVYLTNILYHHLQLFTDISLTLKERIYSSSIIPALCLGLAWPDCSKGQRNRFGYRFYSIVKYFLFFVAYCYNKTASSWPHFACSCILEKRGKHHCDESVLATCDQKVTRVLFCCSGKW